MADIKDDKKKKDTDSKKKSRFSFSKIAKFFREYKSEFKKIVWPTPKQIVNNTIVTLILCAVVGAFIWLIDLGLGYGLGIIYNWGS